MNIKAKSNLKKQTNVQAKNMRHSFPRILLLCNDSIDKKMPSRCSMNKTYLNALIMRGNFFTEEDKQTNCIDHPVSIILLPLTSNRLLQPVDAQEQGGVLET
jgi:hypothetical protein